MHLMELILWSVVVSIRSAVVQDPIILHEFTRSTSTSHGPTVPATRYDPVNRRFTADGEVMIGALLPITRAPGRSGPCTDAKFNLNLNMYFFEPFLFVLRKYNFSLSAWRPTGSRAELSLGFIAGDQCRNGDLSDNVKLALDITATYPREGNSFLEKRCRGSKTQMDKKPILGLVGPWLTDRKVSASAPIMAAHKVPQIAPSIARDEFSCVVSRNGNCVLEDDNQYLFRTGSSDRYAAYAVADILRHFKWTHFGVIAAEDITNKVLLGTFLKRVEAFNLCPAFTATLGTQQDAEDIDRLLRKHSKAKVVVVFANREPVIKLIELIRSKSKTLGQEVPRIWIGNDKWGGAIDLANAEPEKYLPTMQAVFGLLPAIPTHFDDYGHQPSAMAKKFESYILSITASDLRKNPLITGNPLFCRIMEGFRDCSGVCPGSSSAARSRKPRCPENTTLPEKFPNLHLKIVDLAEPATMFAADILVKSLQLIFQKTVGQFPKLTGNDLKEKFYENAQGDKLRQVMQKVKFPCDNGGKCSVFPGNFHEMLPEYLVYAGDVRQGRSVQVGSWRTGDFQFNPSLKSLSLDESLINFGINLFPEEKTGLPLLVNGSVGIPTSTCNPKCSPGWGVRQALNHQPVCCHICRPCTDREYSPGGRNSSCQNCPPGYSSAPEHKECRPLPITNMDKLVKITLLTANATLLFLVIVTIMLFVHFWESPLIRSSDRLLSTSIFTGMIGGCVGVGLKVAANTRYLCAGSRFLSEFSISLINATVLIKTCRFARIMLRSSKLDKIISRWSFTTPAQILFIALLCSPVLAVEVVSIFTDASSLQKQFEEKVTYEVCSFSDALTVISDICLMTTMAVTLCLAFFTRKLPVHYNEARLLFMASFSQSASWAVLRPQYYLSEPNTKQVIDVVLVYLNMAALWLWLFLPRIYIIVFNPKRRNQSAPVRTGKSYRGSSASVTARYSVSVSMGNSIQIPASRPNTPSLSHSKRTSLVAAQAADRSIEL